MKSNPRWIPVLFTSLYAGFAIFFPIPPGFLADFIRLLLLSIAALCSLLLWVSYIVWSRRGALSITGIVIIALLLPVAICGIPTAVLSYRSTQLRDLDIRIRKEASVLTIRDEEVRTDHGNPIGVRVRYQARYPKDAQARISHLPPANLSSAPFPYVRGF